MFGFLIDISGDDAYSGGSLGYIDHGGNIVYHNSTPGNGVNGGGYLGFGFLLDGSGSDHYIAIGNGTNGGASRGVGLLVDLAWNTSMSAVDDYNSTKANWSSGTRFGQNGGIKNIACPQGVAVCLAGSVGLLLDVGGEDGYHDDDWPFDGRGPDKSVFPQVLW